MNILKYKMRWVPALLCCLVGGQIVAQEPVRIPICKDGVLYELPQYRNLYSRGIRIKVIADKTTDLSSTSWRVGLPPLNLTGFYYNGLGGSERFRTPPVLELLLGRKTDLRVSQLSVGARVADLQWSTIPTELKGRSDLSIPEPGEKTQYFPLNLSMFDQIVSVICRRGLPVYSKDAESHSCSLRGHLEDTTAVSVHFATGADLEGHWPPVSKADELWPAAISVLEEALSNLNAPTDGTYQCN